MSRKVNKVVSHGIGSGDYVVVDSYTGEVLENENVLNEYALKFDYNFPFMKFNLDYRLYIKEILGTPDYYYLLELAYTVNKFGIIDRTILDNDLCYTRRTQKIKKFKELGLIKNIKMKGWSKTYWFINPYLCHKSKAVSSELASHFKRPEELFITT